MLKERGIALLSLEEEIDTSSAAGELIFHVFGAIGHWCMDLIAAGPVPSCAAQVRRMVTGLASRIMRLSTWTASATSPA